MSEVRVHADFTVKDEESFLRDTRPMIEATQVAILHPTLFGPYCQAQVQSPKVQIPVKGLGVTIKSHGPPTPPHPPITFNHEGKRGKKFKKGRSLSMTLPTHPVGPVGPVGERDQEHWVVLHVQGECYQPPETSRSGSSQVPKGGIMFQLQM